MTKFVLIAFILTVIAFVFLLIGISTPYWNTTETSSVTINSGLFYLCTESGDTTNCQEFSFDTYWPNIVQVLELTGLVLLFVAIVFTPCNHYLCAGNPVLYGIITAILFTTGLMIMVGTIIYGAQIGKQLHFSFALCVIAAVLTIVAAILLINKSSCCGQIYENKREHSNITGQSSIYGRGHASIFVTSESVPSVSQSSHSIRKTRKISPQMEGTTDRGTSVTDQSQHSHHPDNRKRFTTYKCICLCCFRNKHDYVLDRSKMGISKVQNENTYPTKRHKVDNKEYTQYPTCGCFLQQEDQIEYIERSPRASHVHQSKDDTKLTVLNQSHSYEKKEKSGHENVYIERNYDSDPSIAINHNTNGSLSNSQRDSQQNEAIRTSQQNEAIRTSQQNEAIRTSQQNQAIRSSKDKDINTLAANRHNQNDLTSNSPRNTRPNETRRTSTMKTKSEKQPNVPMVHGGGAYKVKPSSVKQQYAIIAAEEDPKQSGKPEHITGQRSFNDEYFDIDDEITYSSQDKVESIQGGNSLDSSVDDPNMKTDQQRKGYIYSRHSGNDVPGFQLDQPEAAVSDPYVNRKKVVKHHKKTIVYQDENMQIKSEQRENSHYLYNPPSTGTGEAGVGRNHNGKAPKRATRPPEQPDRQTGENPKRQKSEKPAKTNQEKKPWRSFF